jgi:hypothetical protein
VFGNGQNLLLSLENYLFHVSSGLMFLLYPFILLKSFLIGSSHSKDHYFFFVVNFYKAFQGT